MWIEKLKFKLASFAKKQIINKASWFLVGFEGRF